MLKFFKIIAVLEGISSILLFFFAMPVKYIFKNPAFVPSIGMLHGILFTIFISITIIYFFIKKWTSQRFLLFLFMSILPCGTFYLDKKYLKNA
jgi:integral membrane protein